MTWDHMRRKSLRVFFVAGPGDVIGTYQHWRRRLDDPSEVALTYSGQFFDACHELGAEAWVIASHSSAGCVHDCRFRVEHRPNRFREARGAWYHIGLLIYSIGLARSAIRFRAAVVIVDAPCCLAFAMLRLLGVKIVPTMHNTFWPAGSRPHRWKQQLLQKMYGWFWRHVPFATICVSAECERQIRELAGTPRGPVYEVRAQYRKGFFAGLRPPPRIRQPFRIMYAGRLERNKGVFDLLDVAERLQEHRPGRFLFDICGSGSAEEVLRAVVSKKGLDSVFNVRGKLDEKGMREAFASSHVVVVPTTEEFAEGLNKVAVEGVLAGRPVITSRCSHALDALGDAIVEVPPGDIAAYAHALTRLADDPAFYDGKRDACRSVNGPFFDRTQSWGAAVAHILDALNTGRQLLPGETAMEST